jgi:signal peptidase I
MSESEVDTLKSISTARKRVAILLLAILVPIFLLVRFGSYRFFKVPSSSMEPTLYPSDYIVAKKGGEYRRGDIVVFKDPDYNYEYLVKRIVGVGGDSITIFGGAVFLNGSYASEPYRHRPIDYVMFPAYVVPDGHLFVLGDNANRSIDSHNWGATGTEDDGGVKGEPRSIPIELIVGKVEYIYLPFGRSGKLEPYPLRTVLAE